MKKSLAVVLGIIAVLLIAWVLFAGDDDNTANTNQTVTPPGNTTQNQTNQTENNTQNEVDPNNYTQGANIGETVDATNQEEVDVEIDDFIFKTTYLRVSSGTQVTWTNNGNVRHNVVSGTNSPKKGLESELLRNGESYSHVFTEPGVYEYFCEPHPTQMRGVVIVE